MDRKDSILIVEHDENVCRNLKHILAMKGYETVLAGTGREALDKAQGRFFNVALLGANLPDMEGEALLPRLKGIHPDMVEIMLNGYASQKYEGDALNKGASVCTCKPLNIDELLVIIQEALENQRQMIAGRRVKSAPRKGGDELEQRVEERTAELVMTNEQLRMEIEERERLAKALTQNEKLNTLSTIAAEVAHEIRNPLVCIGGFARRLQKKFPDLQECDIILRESQRLEKILSRIGDYLKPVEIRLREYPVNKIIAECVDLLFPEMERRRVKCRLNLDPRQYVVYVDPKILARILINLIRNATEAVYKEGNLTISTFESGQDIHIEIKNHPPGPQIKHPEALFMPFAEEGGQSIGLPICYRLLRDMGGLLSFAQDKDFKAFTVSLSKGIQPPRTEEEFKPGRNSDLNHSCQYPSPIIPH
jgi:C4-dicarboxylate-specific signal transduction histidine kinase